MFIYFEPESKVFEIDSNFQKTYEKVLRSL